MRPSSPVTTRSIFPGIAGLALFLFSAAQASESTPEIQADLGGVKSPFTETIRAAARTWPGPGSSIGPWLSADRPDLSIPESDSPLRIRCFHPKDQELYMGIEQLQLIDAPLETVNAVVQDIDAYSKLFPGYKSTKIVERTGNRFLTRWEQIVPVFFLPNVKYEMLYVTESTSPDRRVYRYQLREATTLKKSDGLIVLERLGPKLTRYAELDAFDADWSIAPLFGKEKLWRESVEGLYLSDLGIKLKAEHPDWEYEKVRDEAKSIQKSARVSSAVDRALSKRAAWDPPAGATP